MELVFLKAKQRLAKEISNKNSYKKIYFTVQDENAWSVGLACGGELVVFIEQIN